MKKTTRQSAHYVCAGCGKPFQTLLKLYGHEKTCKGRKTPSLIALARPVQEWSASPAASNQFTVNS